MTGEWITAEELARRKGCAVNTIYGLAMTGKVRSRRIAGELRVCDDESVIIPASPTALQKLTGCLAGQRYKRPKLFWASALIVLVGISAGLYIWLSRPVPTLQPPLPQAAIGGRYEDLLPAQRKLVEDWSGRFTKVMGKPVDTRELYDSLTLSKKTTFSAVTHALFQTRLTDKAGRSMGLTALDLVSRVETIAGRVPNKGGDRQFRIYVEMKPGAQQTLEESREFRRQIDNTIYHKGYPTCFRGSGGTPSIQVSLSRDGKRGDIDVDYRSSTFPVMLVNGHLTASNSDVRAGDNDQRHNTHWSGLMNWWRGFMGLPLYEQPRPDAAGAIVPVSNEPRLGKRTNPEDAIRDFLKAWLVEQNPGVAVGYVSQRAFACMELERGIPVDRGMGRFQLYRAMQSVNRLVGRAESLDQVIRGASLSDPRLRAIAQPYQAEFSMYDVREDLAAQLDCEYRLHPEQADLKKAASTDFGDYIGAVFRMKTPSILGETVATLWAQDKGAWTLLAYDAEPEWGAGASPESQPAQPVASEEALPVVNGDPGMKKAVKDFLEAWYLRKDAAAAFRYLSPRCFPCYNVYRPENEPQANSTEEAGNLIRERMKLLGDWAGTGNSLADLLVAAEPHHPDLKMVKHDQAGAFSIISLPDSMAAAIDCAQLAHGEIPKLNLSGAKRYGTYYASSIRLKRAGDEAAVLWTLWAKSGREWKVVSYLVVTP